MNKQTVSDLPVDAYSCFFAGATSLSRNGRKVVASYVPSTVRVPTPYIAPVVKTEEPKSASTVEATTAPRTAPKPTQMRKIWLPLSIPGNALKLMEQFHQRNVENGDDEGRALFRAVMHVRYHIEKSTDSLLTNEMRAKLVAEVMTRMPPRKSQRMPLSAPGRAVEIVETLTERNRNERQMDDITARVKAVGRVLHLIEECTDDPDMTPERREALLAEVRTLFPPRPEKEREPKRESQGNDRRTFFTPPAPIMRDRKPDEVKIVRTAILTREEQEKRAAEKKRLRIQRAQASAEASLNTRDIFDDARARRREAEARIAAKAAKKAAEKKNKKK